MFTIVKSTSKYALENSVTFLRWWMSSVMVRQMSDSESLSLQPFYQRCSLNTSHSGTWVRYHYCPVQ